MKQLLLLLMAVSFFSACTNYGKKVKKENIEVYYKEGITSEEAEKTAALLSEKDNKSGVRKSFQLVRDGDTIVLRMVVDVEKAKTMNEISFTSIAALVAESSFNNRPVKMELTDTKFKIVRSFPYKKINYKNDEDANTELFGERIKEGNTEVYVKGASADEAALLARYMNGYFKPESVYSFQLLKDDIGNYTVKMVGNPEKINTLDNNFFADLCKGICDKVLSVPAVSFEMTDTKFNSLRTFNYPADTGNTDLNN